MARATVDLIEFDGMALISYQLLKDSPKFKLIDGEIIPGENIEAVPLDMMSNDDWVWLIRHIVSGATR